MLLKVDATWKEGKIQKSHPPDEGDVACTSKLCAWNVAPAVKAPPMQVSEMKLCKPKAERTGRVTNRNSTHRKLFSSVSSQAGMTEAEFLQKLTIISPESVTLGERQPTRNAVYTQYDSAKKGTAITTKILPPSIAALAEESSSTVEFLASVESSDMNIAEIESGTRDQGSATWKDQRRGRVTASKFHRVYTRMNTYKNDPDVDMKPILEDILQYRVPSSELPALKYGRSMEDTAVKSFKTVMTELGHKDCVIEKCGLFISETHPFLGASPDRIVTCSCCGRQTLEVKCPLNCSKSVPNENNVECLTVNDDGIVVLKKQHAYYTQIQGQMALAKCNNAHFFVYSNYGYHIESISFNEEYWNGVLCNLVDFFNLFVADELVSKNVKKNRESTDSTRSLQSAAATSTGRALLKPSKDLGPKKSGKRRSAAKSKAKATPVYLCGSCRKKCLEVPEQSDSSDFSVFCDRCHKWYHMSCVNVSTDSVELQGEYICPQCVSD